MTIAGQAMEPTARSESRFTGDREGGLSERPQFALWQLHRRFYCFAVIVEIVNTGNELMLGRVLNTHQQWLCRQLADLGWPVKRQVAVPDSAEEIAQAVREALGRADLVIATGGLGPTSDDITRECLATMIGKPLREDPSVRQRISDFFATRGRPMPERTRIEAMVPEGAIVLQNDFGTAPGLAIELPPGSFRKTSRPAWLILLPGPPRELRPMFGKFVVPLLKQAFQPDSNFLCRTFRTTGIGESVVEEKLESPLKGLIESGLEVGYCARPGQVDVRFVTSGPEAGALMIEAERVILRELGASIYGRDEDTIEAVVLRLLRERRLTLSVAESCTGGCIADRLTNVPGASDVFLGGFVTYSNFLKQEALGVLGETLKAHGAVSEPVACEMAEGTRRRTGSDFAVAVTGIAGPGGGSDDKPVGTVFIGLASSAGTRVLKRHHAWDRITFKDVTTQVALNELRRLLEIPGP